VERKPNGASSIYRGTDGYWHGRVTIGVKDDGRTDRRHVMGKTQAVVISKVRELERQRDEGTVRRAGSSWTVSSSLTHWVENIAAPFVRENTIAGYRVADGCDGKCGQQHGGRCPQRIADRTETAETKSRAGRRTVGLPDQLVMLLREHHSAPGAEREAAAELWNEGGWLFATPTGSPINPRTDYTEWKRLLSAAGVRDARLHDARHTAATVLLILGVPERAVMGVMGWSNSAMAARYQHVTASIQRDIARRVDQFIWSNRR